MYGASHTIAAYARAGLRRLGHPGAYPASAAALLTFLLLALGATVGFNIYDESYLWYGAQRILAGEIPFRDFQSYYDVGRFYLTAALMGAQGSHGIVALRVAMAAFGALAAGVATRLIFRRVERPGFWMFLAVILTLFIWMGPDHKILDIAGSVVLVAFLAWLIEQPTNRRCFVTGVATGFLAFAVGRNHGLYGAVADVVALVCISLADRRRPFLQALLCWAAGLFVGYAPMLLALLVVPGLWAPFWDSIRLYFVLGSTNLTVPIPWPWTVPSGMDLFGQARYVIVGTLLMVQPLFGAVVVVHSVWRARTRMRPLPPVLFAAGLLALVYTHHALARAGLGHLQQAIFPLLIGAFALLTGLPRISRSLAVTLVCGMSIFILVEDQPLYQRSVGTWATGQVGDDALSLRPNTVRYLASLTGLVNKYVPAGGSFVAVPRLPGLYAMFDRHAGLWSTYELSPAMDTEQARDIGQLEARRPDLVIVENAGRDPETDYSHTNPQVYGYIVGHYVRVSDPRAGSRLQLYVRPDSPYAQKQGLERH